MEFELPLIEGVLIKRYKRFFADVQLPNGEIVVAHCPNTGAMTGCAEPGFKVWISPSNNPKRKLKYTWELAMDCSGNFIGVNTGRANKIVEQALALKQIDEVQHFETFKREFKPENGNSRFDFLLRNENDDLQCFLEVKSVTLRSENIGFFPDAVTTRGAKHCRELASYVSDFRSCILLFCVQHTGIKEVRIAEHIDPDYNLALLDAKSKGVQVIAYGCDMSYKKIQLNQSLPIVF
jgi:sugar fermentation stimulation protein A